MCTSNESKIEALHNASQPSQESEALTQKLHLNNDALSDRTKGLSVCNGNKSHHKTITSINVMHKRQAIDNHSSSPKKSIAEIDSSYMAASKGEKSVCEEGSGITCPTIVEDTDGPSSSSSSPSCHTSREASSCSIQEALQVPVPVPVTVTVVSPKRQSICTIKKESCPSPCSVLDDIYTYDQQRVQVMDQPQQDQSKGRIMAAVPFSLDDKNSVKVADCDVSTIATTSTASNSSSSTSNVNAKSPLNNSNNYRYEYRVTIRMPIVAEECMKWQAIRKTNLEAKLQTKQQQRKKDNQFQAVCWIACFLVSIVYQGKMGRILATLPYVSLTFIIMK